MPTSGGIYNYFIIGSYYTHNGSIVLRVFKLRTIIYILLYIFVVSTVVNFLAVRMRCSLQCEYKVAGSRPDEVNGFFFQFI
jgi:hypothetical protein